MRMTYNLFNQLMETLTCVNISAFGIPKTEEEKEKITQLTRGLVITLLETFQEELGEKWDFVLFDEQESDENATKI